MRCLILKIKDSWLVEFLELKEQGRIPIFQRAYSWKIENCNRLLEQKIKVENAILWGL